MSEEDLLKGMDRNFPVKVHYMLGELVKDGLDHIVSWRPHGRCFGVNDLDAFVEQILPTWFQQTKFASFQRQLNLYGFQRITTGVDKNCYHHPCFLRGNRSLANKIKRTKIKGQGSRKPSCPSSEPDFYQMPFIPEESHESSETTNAHSSNSASTNLQEIAGRAHSSNAQEATAGDDASSSQQNNNEIVSSEQADQFQLRMLLLSHQLQQQQHQLHLQQQWQQQWQQQQMLPLLRALLQQQSISDPLSAQILNELQNNTRPTASGAILARPQDNLHPSLRDPNLSQILSLLLPQAPGNGNLHALLRPTASRDSSTSTPQQQVSSESVSNSSVSGTDSTSNLQALDSILRNVPAHLATAVASESQAARLPSAAAPSNHHQNSHELQAVLSQLQNYFSGGNGQQPGS